MSVGKDAQKWEHLYIPGGNVIWVVVMENSMVIEKRGEGVQNYSIIQQLHFLLNSQVK